MCASLNRILSSLSAIETGHHYIAHARTRPHYDPTPGTAMKSYSHHRPGPRLFQPGRKGVRRRWSQSIQSHASSWSSGVTTIEPPILAYHRCFLNKLSLVIAVGAKECCEFYRVVRLNTNGTLFDSVPPLLLRLPVDEDAHVGRFRCRDCKS